MTPAPVGALAPGQGRWVSAGRLTALLYMPAIGFQSPLARPSDPNDRCVTQGHGTVCACIWACSRLLSTPRSLGCLVSDLCCPY